MNKSNVITANKATIRHYRRALKDILPRLQHQAHWAYTREDGRFYFEDIPAVPSDPHNGIREAQQAIIDLKRIVVDDLNDKEIKAFELVYMSRTTHKDTAQIMNISTRNVERLLDWVAFYLSSHVKI